jgi:hypothetical protein
MIWQRTVRCRKVVPHDQECCNTDANS